MWEIKEKRERILGGVEVEEGVEVVGEELGGVEEGGGGGGEGWGIDGMKEKFEEQGLI